MVVGIKDGLKLVGVSIVCCCAVFVCTFMLNYYLDVLPLKDRLTDEGMLQLYNAQVATAKLTSAISGGVLSLISLAMLVFYIKLYIDSHSAQLGIVKALGYSRGAVAIRFWVFGLSVFVGCVAGYCLGWAVMKTVYKSMTIDEVGEIAVNFHFGLLVALVIAPTALFTALACIYAYFVLKRPVLQLIKGGEEKVKVKSAKRSDKDRPFLRQMLIKTLGARKSLAFFVAFSSFCFSAMLQMGLSMEDIASKTMGYIILAIGVILAVVTAVMAVTTILNANKKNISVMKAFGYSLKDRVFCLLGGYIPFSLLGFGVGTVYQYGLLKIMLNVVFDGVDGVPEYSFNVSAFFIALFLFIVSYAALTVFYVLKTNKVSVKEIMSEN